MFKENDKVCVSDFYYQMAKRITIAVPKYKGTVEGIVVRPHNIQGYWMIRVDKDGFEINVPGCEITKI